MGNQKISIPILTKPSYGTMPEQNELIERLRQYGASEKEIYNWTQVYQNCHKIIVEFRDHPLAMTSKLLSALFMGGILGYAFSITTLSSANSANFSAGLKYTATAVSGLVNSYLSADTAISINKKIALLTITCSCNFIGLSLGMLIIIGMSIINALPLYNTFERDAKNIGAYFTASEYLVLTARTMGILNSSLDFIKRTREAVPFSKLEYHKDTHRHKIILQHDAFKYRIQTLIATADSPLANEVTREEARYSLAKIASNMHSYIGGANWPAFYTVINDNAVNLPNSKSNLLNSYLMWTRENKLEFLIKLLSAVGAGYLAYNYTDSTVPLTIQSLEKKLDPTTAAILARISQGTMFIFSFDWQYRGLPIFIMALLSVIKQISNILIGLPQGKTTVADGKYFLFSLCQLGLAIGVIGFTSFASSEFARLGQKSEADIEIGAAAGAAMNANSAIRISGIVSGLILSLIFGIFAYITNQLRQCYSAYKKLPSEMPSVSVGGWILAMNEEIKNTASSRKLALDELKEIADLSTQGTTNLFSPNTLIEFSKNPGPTYDKLMGTAPSPKASECSTLSIDKTFELPLSTRSLNSSLQPQ